MEFNTEIFMEFNTAILYDIENLIGGYGKADMLSDLSLKEIHDEILKKKTGKIAIQRAYANWSDSRLNILRGDIVELGIEPIQMFGFGRGPQKNASDIQLAIDAVDIAFTRKAIEVFVIVSGDGGFSALAKKLHEYGCMVIGCAFKKVTNRIFEAVCDDFIWIEEPKEDYSSSEFKPEFKDPVLVEYAKRFKPEKFDRDDMFKEAVHVLEFLQENRDAQYLLKSSGLNISTYSQAITYRIQDFNYMALGFTKFPDFIRYVSRDSNIKLIHNPPCEYRLLLHDLSVDGFEDVEPLIHLDDIHTLEHYQVLLAKGYPIFRLPRMEVVYTLSRYLAEHKSQFQALSLGDIIDGLGSEHEFQQNEIKACMLSLISAGCFDREPKNVKLSEQVLSFLPDAPEETIASLKGRMQEKLESLLDRLDNDVFEAVFH